ncbi:GD12359 [Drosophila simulans]|uniref:GD12359 n=1 Tax=Drosophila simulans TaxID=7240 RepID=B4QPD1_DROSI|nr:GD12359 [Drosophila simulans]
MKSAAELGQVWWVHEFGRRKRTATNNNYNNNGSSNNDTCSNNFANNQEQPTANNGAPKIEVKVSSKVFPHCEGSAGI